MEAVQISWSALGITLCVMIFTGINAESARHAERSPLAAPTSTPITPTIEDPTTMTKGRQTVDQVMASTMEYEAFKLTSRSGAAHAPRKSPEKVCYDGLGCFKQDLTFRGPSRLPSTPEYMQTQFLLFTEVNQAKPDILNHLDVSNINATRFRRGQPTIIVVHGFGDNPQASWYSDFRTAVLTKFPSANFIAVDWAGGARAPSYWQAATNTQMTGAATARLLVNLNTLTGLQMSQVHLIGFSLGAHCVGFSSIKLIEFGLPRVGRITGLDPAGPIFHDFDSTARLDEEDADFVQIIHSNSGTVKDGAMGINMKIGHRDFYPNGGDTQPGCGSNILVTAHGMIHGTPNCNHNRAPAYVAESITSSCAFNAFPCRSYEQFQSGECASATPVRLDIFETNPSPAKEKLYFQTFAETTFCAHPIKVTVTVKSGQAKRGSLQVTLYPKQASAETSVHKILKNTEFVAGKTYQEVILSRVSMDDLARVSVEYERKCLTHLGCKDNTHLDLAALDIGEVGEGQHFQCKNVNLPQGQTLKVSHAANDLSGCSLSAFDL